MIPAPNYTTRRPRVPWWTSTNGVLRDSGGKFRTGTKPVFRLKFRGGRPPIEACNPELERLVLAEIAAGASFNEALARHGVTRRSGYRWRRRNWNVNRETWWAMVELEVQRAEAAVARGALPAWHANLLEHAGRPYEPIPRRLLRL